jgi:hypothetical protein
MSRDDKPQRPRGRPKADEPGTTVSTWLPPQEHDRLIRLANAREQSLSKTIRELLSAKS